MTTIVGDTIQIVRHRNHAPSGSGNGRGTVVAIDEDRFTIHWASGGCSYLRAGRDQWINLDSEAAKTSPSQEALLGQRRRR